MDVTAYDRRLISSIADHLPRLPKEDFMEQLLRIGVIDQAKCKILAIREFVADRVAEGNGKVDSMYEAAEIYCCTYEYVRKCIYYYTEIGYPPEMKKRRKQKNKNYDRQN